jgi:tetratricopeptide (TPR) repeat protein
VDTRASPAQLVLKFWIAPQAKYRFEDIQGNFSAGNPIRVVDLNNPGISVQSELGRQSSALAWIGMGLAQEQLGQSEDALKSFKRAIDLVPQSEVVQFFLGREDLFLASQPTAYWKDYLQHAEEAFKNSISLNDHYARAYIGLGSVYLKQAAMMQDIATATDKPVDPQAAQWTQKSIEAYQKVLDMNPDPKDYGNPVEDVARLGLGNAYRLQGTILNNQKDYPSALDSLNRAIQTLEEVRPVFEKSAQDHESHKRYLAQTYEYLGEAYEWQGYTLSLNMNLDQALVSFNNSLDYFNKCIAQGKATSDLIIQNEIVKQFCKPYYDFTKEMYDTTKKALNGGQ